MLTPRDIHEATFKRTWKGYNPEEVDEFLSRVVGEYEAVYRENESLQERVKELKARLEEYSKTEVQIDETLSLAKQAAADVKEAARKEAEAVLKEATAKAQEIERAARLQAEADARRIEALGLTARRFRARLQEMATELDEEFDSWDQGAVTEVSRALRQVAAASDDQVEETFDLQPTGDH